jgi:uncharacterized protein YcgI (DUF1989 family)
MPVNEEVEVPAREGRGVRLRAGDRLDIVDVEGHQVADVVAFRADDPSEYLSPAHTVSGRGSVELGAGAELFSNRRRPLLTIERDDVGRHDLRFPCCDQERYARDFGLPDHPHCFGNLSHALDLLQERFDLRGEMVWNVFMHTRVADDGALVIERPAQGPGATVTVRAHDDLVVLVSACPQDLNPTNDFSPSSLLLRVHAQG